ncbi:MFS transporter [Sphingobium fuliginis]|uniref:MFS transporter n=1 Tax=Sphingobium fuliginis ATCC 27551 TaxID=1208342 RepID=A0A5B8CCJ4_SPHSA|nr:MFS transporter [Sphingobium fuliginis]QDC37258.1 MFS transporter [Sphingobium fuliginis ATCC 27551]
MNTTSTGPNPTPVRKLAVVALGSLGNLCGTAFLYSVGIFMGPLKADLGWSSTEISVNLTIIGVIAFFTSPFAGLLVDRLGPRLIGLVGIAGYFCAFFGLSFAGRSIWTWWLAAVPLGFAAVLVKPTTWAAGVAGLFTKRRGMALGVVIAGASLGSAVWPVIANRLIESLGWRGAYQTLAVTASLIMLPLLFFFYRPSPASERSHQKGWMSAEARKTLRTGRFVRMLSAGFIVTACATACVVHLVPILVSHGVTRDEAAQFAALIGIASLVSRLATGPLLDYIHGGRLGLVTFTLPVVACLSLVWAADLGTQAAAISALCIGACIGAEVDIIVYLALRYFGQRDFGFLFGTIAGTMILGTGTGPLLLSVVHDITGGYTLGLLALVPLFLVAGALIASLGPYPDLEP